MQGNASGKNESHTTFSSYIDDRSIFYSNYFYIFILLIKPSNKHHICHIDADNKDAGQVSKNTNVGEELCHLSLIHI